MCAAVKGSKEVVEALLDRGADIKATSRVRLLPACCSGQRRFAMRATAPLWVHCHGLLRMQAAPIYPPALIVIYSRQDGRTALLYAAANGSKEVVEALLDRGAGIEATTKARLLAAFARCGPATVCTGQLHWAMCLEFRGP